MWTLRPSGDSPGCSGHALLGSEQAASASPTEAEAAWFGHTLEESGHAFRAVRFCVGGGPLPILSRLP
jgi:hypothetical protein